MKKFSSSITIILILFFALAGFYLIYVNNISLNSERSFFNDLINALMGAMVVALVTASIFIFQSRIEGNKEKEKYIYEKKLELYQSIARILSKINSKNEITEPELNELKNFSLEIDLVADEELIKEYDYLINEFNNKGKGEDISEDLYDDILKVIRLARSELEVLTSVSNSKERMKKLEKVITTHTKQTKVRRPKEEMFKIVKHYANAERGENLDKIYNIDVSRRVQKFWGYLIDDEKWCKELKNLGISTNPNDTLKKGILNKRV